MENGTNFTEEKPHSVRSISKTVSCLGAFVAIEKGMFDLDTNILQFFDIGKIMSSQQQMQLLLLMKLPKTIILLYMIWRNKLAMNLP